MQKTAAMAGADESTPSVPQYFSWINNTNEGSTERQTLINLDFFEWMKKTYGMQIRIYAWDAGNFDGAGEGYGNLKGEKFRSQYPHEYDRVVARAKELGIRMGLWGSPDGFGDDPETERERFDFFVHLCRDHHFALFKLDGVCGRLRPEKAHVFAEMLRTCRQYSPDLIVLNHRLDFYEAEPYVTTFLWNGDETYTDVHLCNRITAMHNRAYMFSRGHVDGGRERLAEDHGVCLSSAMDYFEDELIYQAFSRSLILAPEIYGNPWLLKDAEFPKLARVYTYHSRNARYLTQGVLLPEAFGCCAIARGTGEKRLLCTGNDTWTPRTIRVPLDGTIGLTAAERFDVNLRHPYEGHLGSFAYGETVEVTLPPFRAVLIEIATPQTADPVLTNCLYDVIRVSEETGAPLEVRFRKSPGGPVALRIDGKQTPFAQTDALDETEKPPVLLGTLDQTRERPADGEQLYEAAVFAADNDSLEARSLRRAGETAVPQVKAARDAFFAQETYRLRGCEAKNMFDGDPSTFYDAQSKTYCGGMRVDGGCLRIDLGASADADTLEIVCFSSDAETEEVRLQNIPAAAECSEDLARWETAPLTDVRTEDPAFTATIVKFGIHSTYPLAGRLLAVRYRLPGACRYIRIAEPMDRIYAVRLLRNGQPLPPAAPRGNNLQPHYRKRRCAFVKQAQLRLPGDFLSGSRLALAVNGEHGTERVYCCLRADGELSGFPSRAPDYRANVWEHRVRGSDRNNTFFYPLPDDWHGKTVTVYAVFSERSAVETDCKVWLCEPHR